MAQLYPGVLANLLLVLGLVVLYKSVHRQHRLVRLLIAILFVVVNIRYLDWRYTQTLPTFDFSLESIWMHTFYLFEALSAFLLNWHFFVLVAPTNRSEEADQWEKILRGQKDLPSVDILIPTYNEPDHILAETIMAAKSVDYPNYTVWVLDDGNRDWLQEMAAKEGVEYIRREKRVNFKAGNLNHALSIVSADVVCVVDSDFQLRPNFLWRTVGMLNEPNTALIQTPQIYRNSDAIQHNLGGEYAWTEAQCTFSDVMQPGRDRWDNAFCYGTSFVVKRSALDQIGGFSTETVAEDISTSYRLIAEGFKVRYLNEPLSTGLATQDVVAFVKQRARWCRGTMQCLLSPNGVLRNRTLSIVDRLFYLDPVLYHIGSLWTLMLLLSPAVYWWFGIAPFYTDFGHLLVVLAPRILLVTLGFYWLSYGKTIPIVSEVGRIVGILQLCKGVVATLLNPFNQEFSVTLKSRDAEQTTVYWSLLLPLAGIAVFTLLGFLARYLGLMDDAVLWRTDFGLMISLTVYTLWLLYLSCLACVQRPMVLDPDVSRVGSVKKSIKQIALRLF
jgi:cellulose synthase (UDP-forming)